MEDNYMWESPDDISGATTPVDTSDGIDWGAIWSGVVDIGKNVLPAVLDHPTATGYTTDYAGRVITRVDNYGRPISGAPIASGGFDNGTLLLLAGVGIIAVFLLRK